MKALIGRIHDSHMILHQFDTRTWWQEHRAAIAGWLLAATLWGYVVIQVFDTGLRH